MSLHSSHIALSPKSRTHATSAPPLEQPARRAPPSHSIAYWVLGAALLFYVALCTGQRDNLWGSDAWEHHRAIVAMAASLESPGNPTYATADPSLRYTPYTLAMAIVSRTSGIDAYDVLSAAAVLNTLLLLLGLYQFLATYGEQRIAVSALVVMVTFFGVAPNYVHSYALADLPWHQIDAAAFGFSVTLIIWALVRRIIIGAYAWWAWPGVALLVAIVIITHAITGAFMLLGMGVIVLFSPADRRPRLFFAVALTTAGAMVLCLLWPWYPFAALAHNRTAAGGTWQNRGILMLMLTTWSAPALLFATCAIPLRNRLLIRTCLAGAIISYVIALLALTARSLALQRFAILGVFFLHIPIAAFVHDAEFLNPRRWRTRVKGILTPDWNVAGKPILETLFALVLVYCLVPQVKAVLSEPHLARAYVAPLLGKEDKQLNLRQRLGVFLKPMTHGDVVLSDLQTAWPVPSLGGRIVSAMHGEFFVADQVERWRDLQSFFSIDDKGKRDLILNKYGVRWIILNRERLPPDIFASLFEPTAEVNRDGELVLLDAKDWQQAQVAKASQRGSSRTGVAVPTAATIDNDSQCF